MKSTQRAFAVLSLGAALFLPSIGQAQFAKPEDAIKYRQSAFTVMGAHFSRLAPVVRGERPFDAAEVQANVEIVAMMANLPWQGFGEGTEGGRAKPEVWMDQAGFEQAQAKLSEEVAKLAAAARSGELAQVRTAFGAVGASCKACHDNFRD